MIRNPASPAKCRTSLTNDESSVEDYEEAFLDVEDGELDLVQAILPHRCLEASVLGVVGHDSRPSSADWEEPESWVASMANSESCPLSSTSSGASPFTETSSQGVSPLVANSAEQAFTFSIPESTMSDVLQVEKDFMDYVMSFPAGAPAPPPPPASKKPHGESSAKVGLDHLDNLCKLMEQLSDLKEANLKLKRRVQYLEDIKTLHEIHKEMVGERPKHSPGLSEEDVQHLQQASKRETSEESNDDNANLKPESEECLYSLYRSKTANQIESTSEYKFERGHKSRSSTSTTERRERSKSVGHAGHGKPKKRPSRWSKVKEVLGIEKTDDQSTVVEGDKSDERVSEEGSFKGIESNRVARKDNDYNKSHKISASRSHSNVMSSRSFSGAQHQDVTDINSVKKSGTVDFSKTTQSTALDRSTKDDIAKKSPKTPWGKMKTMIQIRRDNRHHKSESSSSSPRDANVGKPVLGQKDMTNGHTPNRRSQRSNHRSSHPDTSKIVTQAEYEKFMDDRHSQNCKHDQERIFYQSKLDPNYQEQQRYQRRKSCNPYLDTETRFTTENEANVSQKVHQTDSSENSHCKENGKRFKSKPHPLILEEEGDHKAPAGAEEDRNTSRSPYVSPMSQRKWMWTKVKDVLKGKKEGEECPLSLSVPSSPSSVNECLAFDFDLDKVKEDGSLNSEFQSPRVSETGPENMMLPLSGSSPSTTVAELLRELQQNLSDDFNKKLEEWQKCRSDGIHKPSPEVERKDSFGRIRKISKPEKKVSTGDKVSKSNYHIPRKDLSWLDKEYQKVEREIVRLSKEKQKFEKRAFRLKHLKEAMMDKDGPKKEVLVKTSAGEFRFEGISDAFTKKLYEWETKKGVGPELSTIALLDESLKPHHHHHESPVGSTTVGSNSTRPSPEPKNCFQVSRASSEPDLSSAQKDVNSGTVNPATRSKSGDTLLSGDKEMVATLEEDENSEAKRESRYIVHGDDNYYSLLEENMYLLDQLKEKEEICGQLQNELDRLDDKTEKTNRTHQEEMEKYRQKLWEIHMSRPRDLQGSLHLISELKSRIEELQKCSDKLKSDREGLEESFRYHSSQQARLAEDLIRRIQELQDNGNQLSYNRSGCRRKWKKTVKCDANSVARIHELSTKLLQQARDVEQALMERTRQVCHLRWELLHRDMSAVLLQAALHRVTSQGEPVTILPTWDKRRNKFKNLKAWSVDTTTRRPSEDLVTDNWLQERLRQLSMTPYSEWTNIDFSPNDLMTTAHELKKETLKLSMTRIDKASDEEKKSATWSADSEMADSDRYYDTGSAVNSRSSSFSSGPGGLKVSHSDTRLYERARALRRNSSSSMSCVEASDSSSMHDSDKMHCLVKRFPWRTQWRSLDNMSSSCSSRSSVLEEDVSKTHWRSIKPANKTEHNLRDNPPCISPSPLPLCLKYGSVKEVEEENEEVKSSVIPSTEWGSQCLITPRPVHLPRISDTESDKNADSPIPHFGKTKSTYSVSHHTSVRHYPEPSSSYSHSTKGKRCQQLYSSNFSGIGSCGDASTIYKSATDGSMESLDKYETAIRDEELTFSDEQGSTSHFVHRQGTTNLETFSEFEEELRQRTTTLLERTSDESYLQQHHSIADYIDRDKQQSQPSEARTHSTPGSPNISKYKYKGTKGFGRSPRLNYRAVHEDFTFHKLHDSASELSKPNDK